MSPLDPTARRALLAVGVLGLASLASCGGHHDDDHRDTSMPPVGTTQPPPATTDAFISVVSQIAATQDETGEPVSTEGINPTSPETTEPLPLPVPTFSRPEPLSTYPRRSSSIR